MMTRNHVHTVTSYLVRLAYPKNIASAARQRASAGQSLCGGQQPLTHYVAQRWPTRWASGGWPPLGLLFHSPTILCATYFVLH